MRKSKIKKFNFDIGKRLHKTESMPYWAKIIKKNGKLFGINGNGESIINFSPKSKEIFTINGIYKISYPIWCNNCNDWADVFCGNFHDVNAYKYVDVEYIL